MKKKIGLLLISGAFLAGALMTSLDANTLPWAWFIPTLLVGFAGLWMVKSAQKSAAKADHKLAEDIQAMGSQLERIVTNLDKLDANKETLPTYEARFEIDKLFREDLDGFAERRASMQHQFGLRQYADIMSAFAAGERYINRVWTASTDGYVDEVKQYLAKAAQQMHEAKKQFVAAVESAR